jgi:hypothetical protein
MQSSILFFSGFYRVRPFVCAPPQFAFSYLLLFFFISLLGPYVPARPFLASIA